MSQPIFSRRLSVSDAAFLYLERKEIPLCIACVCVFDEAIPFEEFVANIDSKLHLVPRYLQIAVSPPFDIGYPIWEDDPHFDIRRHIFRVTLETPGGDVQLEALAGRLFTQVMDRRKPLWEVYVVDGLQGGRGALIVRVHHALADGVAGASLVKVMLDTTPEGSQTVPKRRTPRAKTEPVEHSLVEAIGSAVHSSLENLIAAEEGILDFSQSLLGEPMQAGLQELARLLPEVASPTPRLPFNKPCNGDRLFCWAEFRFDDVHAIRATIGCKVNDVVLTVLTRAVALYAVAHGQSIDHRLLRVVCPVSIRREEQAESLGNRITFMPVVLPMDISEPMEMLAAVAARTAAMKNTRAAELVAIATAWLGSAPPPLQKLFWGGIPSLMFPAPLFNIICTNVPGSPATLYAVGKKMIASYPQVPTGYELGVGVAAQSYAGKLCFGLTADSEAAPDVTLLRDLIQLSFEELRKAAGVKRAKEEKPVAALRTAPPPPAKAAAPTKKTATTKAAVAATKAAPVKPAPTRRVPASKEAVVLAEAATPEGKVPPAKAPAVSKTAAPVKLAGSWKVPPGPVAPAKAVTPAKPPTTAKTTTPAKPVTAVKAETPTKQVKAAAPAKKAPPAKAPVIAKKPAPVEPATEIPALAATPPVAEPPEVIEKPAVPERPSAPPITPAASMQPIARETSSEPPSAEETPAEPLMEELASVD